MYRKLSLLFVIALVLVSGCTTVVPPYLSPEEETTGSLEISSTPSGSEIYLDGVFSGTTPMTFTDLSAGSHTVELRYRDYIPWVKSIEIRKGTRSYVDTTLNSVIVPTSLPTTVPTTIPTTIPTIVPATTPVPKTPAGCWKLEFSSDNSTIRYFYDLRADGSGWFSATRTSPTISERFPPEGVTWLKDPASGVVTILQPRASDPADPHRAVLNYNENADILYGGEKGGNTIIFERVPCEILP